MNGGDLDSALGLLNGPGVDANGNLLQQKSSWKWELERDLRLKMIEVGF